MKRRPLRLLHGGGAGPGLPQRKALALAARLLTHTALLQKREHARTVLCDWLTPKYLKQSAEREDTLGSWYTRYNSSIAVLGGSPLPVLSTCSLPESLLACYSRLHVSNGALKAELQALGLHNEVFHHECTRLELEKIIGELQLQEAANR